MSRRSDPQPFVLLRVGRSPTDEEVGNDNVAAAGDFVSIATVGCVPGRQHGVCAGCTHCGSPPTSRPAAGSAWKADPPAGKTH